MDFMGLFSRRSPTKDLAKSRLKLVLVQDRLNCSSEIMERLKMDILDVISRYMEFEAEELDIQVTNARDGNDGDSMPMLIANIPVRNIRKVSNR